MAWFPWILLAAALTGILALGLTGLGASRWAKSTEALTERLDAGRAPPTTERYDTRELMGLPAPVRRYFDAVLTDGQAMVTAATIEMAGSFNMSATGEQWRPFTSMQRVTTRRPGFVWDARIAMLPGTRRIGARC